MTFTEEFIPEEGQDIEESPDYPTAFGITFTPMIGGVLCGIIGFVGAAYILAYQVLPAQQSYKELQQTKKDRQAQIEQQKTGEAENKISDLEGKLKQLQTLRPKVLSLFSQKNTIDTLLLDLNSFVDNKKANLLSFESQGNEGTIIEDGSLGKLVDGQLKRQSIDMELEGTFEQTQLIMRNIEQYQPLLLIKDFSSQASDEQKQRLSFDSEQGKLIPKGQTKLKTSFRLDLLSPLSSEEINAMAKEKVESEQK